jgi:hypothetical protein
LCIVRKYSLIFLVLFIIKESIAQLPVARDTIMVIENGKVLKMPWANGLNYSNVSQMDLNCDGKKDLVIYDKINQYGSGVFRCFIKEGNPGQLTYKASPQLSYHFPQVNNWAVLVDYNCDGKEDIFCSTNSGIKVYKNTSVSCKISFSLIKPLLYSDYFPSSPGPISNLYASPVGVPGIADIDNDGDIDILTFSPQGILIEFHKNMKVENSLPCDSLVFERQDDCWGDISESSCLVTLSYCTNKPAREQRQVEVQKEYHAGSCLTCFDSDGDGDKDLVMGDISCNTLEYVHNNGSITNAHFTDTTKLYPNYPSKNNTTGIKLNTFPCAYYIDADDDGKNDLLASPNAPGSENYKSLWLYKNASSTNTVNFQFVKNNFLQDEMIEVGQNSYPVVFDYDLDGKKDLLVGTYGYYNNSSLTSSLTLYRNIGTTSTPSYSLITRDYANLSSKGLSNIMPTVGDVDKDGDQDICIGTSSGQIHWLENTAGGGFPCNFSVFKTNPFTFTTISAAAAPQLFDLDADGKLDLLIGMMNGNIAFYKNRGTSPPSFSLVTNNLGNVSVKGDINLFGLDGFAVPYFYQENSSTKLLVGSVSGYIWQYDVPANVTGNYVLLSNRVNGINEGGQSTICYEDINADSKRDVIIGNAAGGLSYFSSASPFVGINEQEDIISNMITLFPNPVMNTLNVVIQKGAFKSAEITVNDVLGRQLLHDENISAKEVIDLSALTKGIYFVRINIETGQQNYSVTKRIIKE